MLSLLPGCLPRVDLRGPPEAVPVLWVQVRFRALAAGAHPRPRRCSGPRVAVIAARPHGRFLGGSRGPAVGAECWRHWGAGPLLQSMGSSTFARGSPSYEIRSYPLLQARGAARRSASV